MIVSNIKVDIDQDASIRSRLISAGSEPPKARNANRKIDFFDNIGQSRPIRDLRATSAFPPDGDQRQARRHARAAVSKIPGRACVVQDGPLRRTRQLDLPATVRRSPQLRMRRVGRTFPQGFLVEGEKLRPNLATQARVIQRTLANWSVWRRERNRNRTSPRRPG
jgi:hypothetical protein